MASEALNCTDGEALSLFQPDRLDDDGIDRDVLVRSDVLRFHGRNHIDDIHAFDNLSENSVPIPLIGGILVVEVGVICMIDEELAGRAVFVGTAGHGYRSAQIREPVVASF